MKQLHIRTRLKSKGVFPLYDFISFEWDHETKEHQRPILYFIKDHIAATFTIMKDLSFENSTEINK